MTGVDYGTQGMDGGTHLSVVITAFNRKEFWADAVSSVLPQVKGRDDIEVIVLKNFDGEEVDRRLEGQGVRIGFESSPNVGLTLRRAFDLSHGEYVAFLDDDDLFLPSKIARFEHVLRRVPGLGYYHNQYELSIQSRDGLGAWERLTSNRVRRPSSKADVVSFANMNDQQIVQFLTARNREQNLSSTIVSRDVGARIRPWLESLPVMSDTTMLAAGLLSGKSLVFDQAVETVVRRHDSNHSNKRRHLDVRLNVMAGLSEAMAKAMAPQAVQDYWTLRAAREIVYGNLVGAEVSSTATRQAVRVLAHSYIRQREQRDLGFILLGGVGSLFPRLLPLLRPLAAGS
jgi:glycosyltransferase involved in cell wall biosynthesis